MTLQEFDPAAQDIYDYCDEAVEIDGMVYLVKKDDIDPYSDMFLSNKNENGTIDFYVKFYNGCCSFNEAINNAIEANDTKQQ